MVDFFARGWGLMMMALRVFRQISVLKMAVDVGLVVGMTAARRHQADGLGDLPDAVGRVLFDDAAGLRVPVGVVDVLRRVVVLDDLVLHHAHARLLHGHLGQRYAGLVGGHGRGAEDAVNILLAVLAEFPLRGAHHRQLRLQRLNGGHGSFSVLLCHIVALPFRVRRDECPPFARLP